MNGLPNELLVLILKELSLDDLFNSCKLVNKRWWHVINEHLKPDELIIYKKYCPFKNYWFHTYKPIDPKSLICSTNLRIDRTFKKTFINLRFLKIDYPIKDHVGLEYLNEFGQHLAHLEFTNIVRLHCDTSLCLPKLRVLYVLFGSDGCKLLVESNELKILFANHLCLIELANKETVEFIETSYYDDFDEFSNLKTLKLTIAHFNEDHMNILSQIPDALQRIHFYSDFKFPQANILFSHILNQKTIRNLELKIYNNGVELLANRSFDDYGFDLASDTELHHRNAAYLEHDGLTNYTEFSFNELIRVYRRVSSNFFKKYVNIQLIDAKNSIGNEDHFKWFIEKCRNLSVLRLVRTSLSNNFYNQLPHIAPSLTRLILLDEHTISNYEFILGFRILSKFYTMQHVPIRTGLQAVKNLRFIESFHFENGGKKIIIYKSGRWSYDLKYGLKNPCYLDSMDFETLQQLLENPELIRIVRSKRAQPSNPCSIM